MNLLIGVLLTLLGQSIIWFQTNGQFIWPWFKNHPFLISVLFGTSVSYIFILGTKYLVSYFNGVIWPARLIGFGLGMVVFTACAYVFMGESINSKTSVSLLLAFTIVYIQIFWK
tara:strand:- start:9289 stop:9630 length:342 start_codon:yes stop_codon:yes gene_type:complete